MITLAYSDVNASATYTNPEIKTGIDSAMQRLMFVLATRKGSRYKRPNFGTFVSNILFDPLDAVTALKLRNEIEDTIKDPENDLADIQFDKLEVIPDIENQSYYVTMKITVDNLDEEKNIEFGLRAAA